MEWIETLMDNKHNALKLLGYFSRSLRWNDWHEQHPGFSEFCSGVLDFVFCPPDMKRDAELVRMFPPKALAGITNPGLRWRAA
jgi:hypothetical protein